MEMTINSYVVVANKPIPWEEKLVWRWGMASSSSWISCLVSHSRVSQEETLQCHVVWFALHQYHHLASLWNQNQRSGSGATRTTSLAYSNHTCYNSVNTCSKLRFNIYFLNISLITIVSGVIMIDGRLVKKKKRRKTCGNGRKTSLKRFEGKRNNPSSKPTTSSSLQDMLLQRSKSPSNAFVYIYIRCYTQYFNGVII